jgi:predicted RNA-binding Zn ribbon-like protein
MQMTEWENAWDFDADRLSLDFANTVEWHAGPEPEEKLESYSDLVGWSWAADLLEQGEARSLLEEASRKPETAEQTLTKALEIREAIYAIFSAIASSQKPPGEALDTFNRALAHALEHARIVPGDPRFVWGWSAGKQLDRMLWPILQDAAGLLTSDGLDRVGECADDRGCGYLFFDSSRNRSRRWCNMESCGNRAKAMRYYSRKTGKDPIVS